jgi:hypothetical protein
MQTRIPDRCTYSAMLLFVIVAIILILDLLGVFLCITSPKSILTLGLWMPMKKQGSNSENGNDLL